MFIKKFVLQAAGGSLAAIVLMTAPRLGAQTASESERLQKLERAVEQLQKRNAELEQEVSGLKKQTALAAEVGTWRPPDPGPSRHDGSPHRAASGRFYRLPNTGPECRQCSAPRVSLDRLEAEGQDGALTTPARGTSLFQSAGSASQGR